MMSKSGSIAENDEFHAGSGDGDIHAAQIVQETDIAFFVGTDEADENDIPFLSLKTVDGVDGDEAFQGMKEVVAFNELADILHLHPVRGDQPEVNAFFQDSFHANFLDVIL